MITSPFWLLTGAVWLIAVLEWIADSSVLGKVGDLGSDVRGTDLICSTYRYRRSTCCWANCWA